MEEKLLSISQLAKLRKLTPETLRHYDRIGLIKPEYVDPVTKYRYYSIRQYEKIGTIKELRQLGMSLDMISGYFENRNFKKSSEILNQYADNLLFEINEQYALYQTLKKKIAFIDSLNNLPEMNVVREVNLPERYVVTFGEKAGGSKEHALIIAQLESHLNEIAPILASDRVGVYAEDTILKCSEDYIPSVPMLFVDDDLQSDYKQKIPAGRYLSLFYSNGHLERYHKSFEIAKKYLKEHHLKIDGNILQIYKIDVTLTSYAEETVLELQIPVSDK